MQTKRIVVLSVLMFTLIISSINAQPMEKNNPDYSISGKVVDKTTGKPIEYATAVLLETEDSMQVKGIATGVDGKFTLRVEEPGTYILNISFVGYSDFSKKLKVNKEKRHLNLGKIKLQ